MVENPCGYLNDPPLFIKSDHPTVYLLVDFPEDLLTKYNPFSSAYIPSAQAHSLFMFFNYSAYAAIFVRIIIAAINTFL